MKDFIEEDNNNCILVHLKVKTNARKNSIIEIMGNRMKINLTASPEKNKANTLLVIFLADLLNISKHDIKIIRGKTKRQKTIMINNVTKKEFINKIKL